MKRLSTFLPLLLVLSLLQGCFGGGGGGGGGNTQLSIRLVDGTSDTLDMVTGSTKLASAIAYGTGSSYTGLTTGAYAIELENTGTGIPLAETNFAFSSTAPTTLLAYTSGQSVRMAEFIENEPAPAAGDGKIRIADLATDAGNVDVYISTDTNPADDTYSPTSASLALSAATPLVQAFSGTSSYFELLSGTYHVWVTGAGDKTDLRLDTQISISNLQVSTLALTGTTGGGLVDGLLVTQQGAVTALQNPNARIRIAANTTTALSSATANGVSLLGGSTYFNSTIGSYVLVPAGSTAINGPACSTFTTTHGEDLTLLVTATGCNVLVDDNTRPSSGFAKLRLVNGINGGSAISLTDNYLPIASNVIFGAASIPTANNNQGIVSSGIASALAVTPTAPAFSAANVTLESQGVYSLFMLGNSTATTGTLVHDH